MEVDRLVFRGYVTLSLMVALLCVTAHGQFTIRETGSGVAVLEDGKPFLVYHFRNTQQGASTHFIHPLFDTYGNELTALGPSTAPPVRGAFWAWPAIRAEGRTLNLVTGEGGRREFERFTRMDAAKSGAVISFENAWIFEGSPRAYVMEAVELILWPSDFRSRTLDIRLKLTNVSDGLIELTPEQGMPGGLILGLDPGRGPFTYSTASGTLDDTVSTEVAAWVDASYRLPRTFRYGGVTVFQHPDNPGYPNTTWGFDTGGLFSTVWPDQETVGLEPGEAVDFWFRLYIHTGFGPEIDLAAVHRQFIELTRGRAAVEPDP